MAINFLEMLKKMRDIEASDLHLKTGVKPLYRQYGTLTPAAEEVLGKDDLKAIVNKIVPERLHGELEELGGADFAFSIDKQTRFRGNAFYQRGTLSVALRILQNEHQSFEALNLPEVMNDIADYRRGMILVTGPTGSGKSTTMAAMIHNINASRNEHIITIEDPIEFMHDDLVSLVQQREIGADAESFQQALRHALRQDPDVILVGEMRDKDTIQTATRAAMTGHLVVSTLHTINAIQTINRILKYFPPEEQASVANELATALRAVIAQRLVPKAGGKGRVAQLEIMIVNDMVKKLMRMGKIDDIDQVLKNGMDGMQHFDLALVDLVKKELVDADKADTFAEDVAAFRRLVKSGGSGGDRSGLIGF
jgi:twitching motility protein PilT